MLYLELFLSFVQIGLFSIGGGMAAIPLIENQVVVEKGWLALSEFVDLITIAEMTPGPIAINSATFVGTKVAGFLGAIMATLGVVTPSLVIVLTLAYLYNKYEKMPALNKALSGLRPAVVALIASAGYSIVQLALKKESHNALSLGNVNLVSIVIMVVSFTLLAKFKKSPIFIIILTGLIGIFSYAVQRII